MPNALIDDGPVVVIPAAGASTRFGSANKLLALVNGRPMLSWVIQAATAITRTLLVVGTDARIAALAAGSGAVVVHNHEPDRGMGSTIACGVEASDHASAWLVWPADLPFIKSETATAVMDACRTDRIVVPEYAGQWGHPVGFGSAFAGALRRLDGAAGGRGIIHGNTGSVHTIVCTDSGIVRDIDTRIDLAAAHA